MLTRSGKIGICAALVTLLLAVTLPVASAQPERGPAATPSKAKEAKAKAATKQRGIYWGAWIGTQLTGGQPPWDMSALSHFEGMTGKGLSLLHFAAPFADCSSKPCDFYEFPEYEMQTIRNYGAIPFFSWGSQSIPVPADLNEPEFQLADITAGTYDKYLREFAEGARDWGHPFFLRFNWEMNGDWFPWAEHANGNQPNDYINSWRHVHDIFSSVGANNANWVWCPYVNSKPQLGPLARFYPGGDYVDWTCLDGFNWAKNAVNSQPWTSFDEIFGPSYRTIVNKLAPEKPMLLGEFASGGGAKAKATWIKDMFTHLRTKYRRIRGMLWFNQIDRGVQWPIETAPSVTAAFSRGVRQTAFAANHFSGLAGTKIVPPR
ncbi:MAG TPA: glycosyl hydrolase [Solirubrobacterales bacterium]|nr:glycosyl hydrolase [Solirubrobacterales bacterium]